jgi:hypothetical protein
VSAAVGTSLKVLLDLLRATLAFIGDESSLTRFQTSQPGKCLQEDRTENGAGILASTIRMFLDTNRRTQRNETVASVVVKPG